MNEINSELSTEKGLPSEGRRRLIKLGTSAVPVFATLTSQSALAGVCVTTSAWGSDQISGSASQKTRHGDRAVSNNQTVDAGFTISAWNTAATTAIPKTPCWQALRQQYPALNIKKVGLQQNERTFGDLTLLDNTLFKLPAGVSSSGKVVGNLTGTSDAVYFLVAQLNYAAGKRSVACFSDTDWKQIVAGTYNPQGLGAWDLAKTVAYLKAYGIVIAS